MKIEGNGHLFDPGQRLVRNDGQADALRAGEPNSRKTEDRLEISARSLQLRDADLTAAPSGQVRANRVAEISRQVETLTYTVNAEKVAEAIISGSLVDKTT